MKEQSWHRRNAIQVVSMLPDDAADAIAVLDFARDLVLGFLSEPKSLSRPTVVSIRGNDECA